ncbi:LOW QUALITY PROTEIN: hypothetical protein OSB04_028846 [Centaurea solstitialis]|uniref:Integrase catalytic domain-containing protein n=1 Tax=Centaurea solstitialis TaxID=347529 RepID=A0AA38SGK6_9ASTR|nr:LOW QUALITY PROTEIN: hypothetical protein OSB04_028846 [Centaurea solstitialis]
MTDSRKTRSKASRYTIFEDQLYRRSTTGLLLRCVINKTQIDRILQEMHDGECGNHAGGRSLANLISRQGYYWPTQREDPIRYVRHCDACQKHSGMTHRPSEPLHSVLIPWPFMRWGMDIVGKLPPALGQKVYLLVLTDYFSKWIEAGAFSQVRDKEVISFIQNNIIHRFGVPSEIMCDNGSQFISDKTRTFCEKRGIKLVTSTPRYPQSNGLVESSNKVIINSIRKRLKGAKGKWVEELPSVLWANRTTPRAQQDKLQISLVYGCEAVLPIEAQIHVARNGTFDQNAINLSYDLDALEELRENALRTMAAQKGLVERHFNKKVKAKIFQVGDYVLRHVFQNTQEPNAGKHSMKWEGPYVISKVIGNGAYQLTTMEGIEIPRSWNAHHLKRYRTIIASIARVSQGSHDYTNCFKRMVISQERKTIRQSHFNTSRRTIPIFENQLYRRSTTGLLLRCVINKMQIDLILQEMHDGECGNHAGGRSLANRISRQGYYWPTLREDAIRYVRHCNACQKHSGMTHRPSEPLHSVLIPWPFMRWGMTSLANYPLLLDKKFIYLCSPIISRKAGAFSQVRDKEVISFIQNNIIHRFGVPSEIMCENGSQFISDKTRTFCEKRGIKLVTSTPRYPQSNGLAESSNKVIIKSIRKRLKGAKGKWVEELPSVLWANRTTPRTSTGQTPYSLVYGCEAVLPIEAQIHVARNRTFDQNAINLSYDLDALEELRENALRTMAAQKGLVERHFNKKVKAKIFQVGDYLLQHVFQNTHEPNAGKLSIKWEGPYVISKVIGNGAYQLTTMEGIEIPRSWNAHHLKRYYF